MPDERQNSIRQGMHAPKESPSGQEAAERNRREAADAPEIGGGMGGTSDADEPADETLYAAQQHAAEREAAEREAGEREGAGRKGGGREVATREAAGLEAEREAARRKAAEREAAAREAAERKAAEREEAERGEMGEEEGRASPGERVWRTRPRRPQK